MEARRRRSRTADANEAEARWEMEARREGETGDESETDDGGELEARWKRAGSELEARWRRNGGKIEARWNTSWGEPSDLNARRRQGTLAFSDVVSVKGVVECGRSRPQNKSETRQSTNLNRTSNLVSPLHETRAALQKRRRESSVEGSEL